MADGFLPIRENCGGSKESADDQSARAKGTHSREDQDGFSRAQRLASKAWGLHARLHDDSEEAELGAPQSRSCPSYQRDRGHDVCARRRSQPSRALDRFDSRRACEGFARRSLPHRSRRTRRERSGSAPPGTLQVRGEETQKRCEEEVGRPNPMSRRRDVPRREIAPDPRYGSTMVAKFVSCMMSAGKKSVAEGIFYRAMDQVEEKTGMSALTVF